MLLRLPTEPVKETTLVLHGNPSDHEVKTSIKKAKRSHRKVEVKQETHDTGHGNCGKICSCGEGQCAANYKGMFPGDSGPSMGMSY